MKQQTAGFSMGQISNHTKSIHIRQVDFITEEHEPFVQLHRRQNKAVGSLAIFAVMIKSLQHQLRSRSAGEVESNNLYIHRH